MKTILNEIGIKLEKQDLITLDKVKSEIAPSASGFYWIYTKLKVEEFIESPIPSNRFHINLQYLAKIHNGLDSVSQQENDEYWCIYNGKGKQLKNRIVAEFTDTSGKTGKLALQRCFDKSDFRIKYISCCTQFKDTGISESYDNLEKDLERVWRLDNCWPIFCRS